MTRYPQVKPRAYVFFNVKPWMFLLLALAYRTLSTSSRAHKHTVLPPWVLLYRYTRTGITGWMPRAELQCLSVVHWGAVFGKYQNVRKKKALAEHPSNHSQASLAKKYWQPNKTRDYSTFVCMQKRQQENPGFILSHKRWRSYILSFVLGDADPVSALVLK